MIQMDSHYLNNTQHVYDKGRVMQTEQQRAVTRLCIQCGLFLLQHGAESALVDELSSRLGRALGMDSVESSISSNAIVLTTIKDGQCLTSTRKNHDRGINMHVVTEVQHIVILAEHHLLDYKGVEKRFSQIQPLRYPRWLVALMVGLSCACFCKLNKGGWDGAVITFFASTAAMYIRQLLAQRHLHPHQYRTGTLGDRQSADTGYLRRRSDGTDDLGATRMGVIEFLLALAQDMILAAIPAVGFAMVFNVPVRALRWCALLGAIGHGSRMILMTSGLNIEWSTFMASMLVGTIGIQWSRWYLAHPKVFTVAAVIPMFPGISAYTAMISAVKISQLGYSESLMITLLTNFLTASSIVGALSIGLSIPGLWLYRKRPRV